MEKGKPLISVLVPSLNSQDYIGQCVESISNQTLNEIEIICIDAGSDDNTIDILNGLANEDSRIKIIHSDKKSYGFQMNLGLANASGKYISIVESDDFIDEEMLKSLYDLSEKYDCDITKSTFYHYYDYSSGKELEINNAKKSIDVENPFRVINYPVFLDGHPSIWAGIYRKDFLDKNQIRFMEEDGAGWVDNPFFYQTTFQAEKIVYRHVPYYYYRETNPNSSSNNLSDFTIPIKRMMDNLDIVEKFNLTDELILKHVYLRAFAYIYNIFRREGYEDHMDVLRPCIRKMLLRLDEEIVLKHMKQKMKDTYYDFVSPLKLIDSKDCEIAISNDDLSWMVKENEYLYSRLNDFKINKQKKNRQIKSLKKEINLIKNSKSYRIALSFSKVFNKIKSLFKSS